MSGSGDPHGSPTHQSRNVAQENKPEDIRRRNAVSQLPSGHETATDLLLNAIGLDVASESRGCRHRYSSASTAVRPAHADPRDGEDRQPLQTRLLARRTWASKRRSRLA